MNATYHQYKRASTGTVGQPASPLNAPPARWFAVAAFTPTITLAVPCVVWLGGVALLDPVRA